MKILSTLLYNKVIHANNSKDATLLTLTMMLHC